ncbi:ubiquitin fubi and ribosomal S30 [Paramuricea clavata]|uniref:Ubiquitin fubi and ribosomal S30 n=1 Tax=Paramuricea clavata TaxID=317549 RepID=A0A7D9HEY3_PARCT|nr:ubiquitin fubi and ribosomal S30 [Paramuricea clavata]
MQLFIRGAELNVVCVDECLTVDGLKHQIADLEGITVEDQVLSFGGKPLEGESTLVEYGIHDSCTLDVVGRVLGGKVHGSLARAGKVKGQTPKVDKQEKKKKRTGRAKRRMQYNRRFVNVVQTFGKRRGPNSNAP